MCCCGFAPFKMNVGLCRVLYHSAVVACHNSMLWPCVVDCKLWEMGTVMTGWMLDGACHLFSFGNSFVFVFIAARVCVTSLFDAVFVIASSVPERFRWH